MGESGLIADDLLVALFAVWFVLSVSVYAPKLRVIVRRWDYLALIPEWQFFAPIPGEHDYHLLYRDRLRDGTMTEWTELDVAGRRRWWNAGWNTRKRRDKALFDAVNEFAAHLMSKDRALLISIPYLTLLNYISSAPRSPASAFTQFLLMRSRGGSSDEDPSVVFLSGLHAL